MTTPGMLDQTDREKIATNTNSLAAQLRQHHTVAHATDTKLCRRHRSLAAARGAASSRTLTLHPSLTLPILTQGRNEHGDASLDQLTPLYNHRTLKHPDRHIAGQVQ